jgi:hypothetical protein
MQRPVFNFYILIIYRGYYEKSNYHAKANGSRKCVKKSQKSARKAELRTINSELNSLVDDDRIKVI